MRQDYATFLHPTSSHLSRFLTRPGQPSLTQPHTSAGNVRSSPSPPPSLPACPNYPPPNPYTNPPTTHPAPSASLPQIPTPQPRGTPCHQTPANIPHHRCGNINDNALRPGNTIPPTLARLPPSPPDTARRPGNPDNRRGEACRG